MDASFIRERISVLRIKKNVSEYKMSLDLGHGKGYIQAISSGRALPSMGECHKYRRSHSVSCGMTRWRPI